MPVANHRQATAGLPLVPVLNQKRFQLCLHRLADQPLRASAHQVSELVSESWIGLGNETTVLLLMVAHLLDRWLSGVG